MVILIEIICDTNLHNIVIIGDVGSLFFKKKNIKKGVKKGGGKKKRKRERGTPRLMFLSGRILPCWESLKKPHGHILSHSINVSPPFQAWAKKKKEFSKIGHPDLTPQVRLCRRKSSGINKAPKPPNHTKIP